MYAPGETVAGQVVISSNGGMSHNGINIKVCFTAGETMFQRPRRWGSGSAASFVDAATETRTVVLEMPTDAATAGVNGTPAWCLAPCTLLTAPALHGEQVEGSVQLSLSANAVGVFEAFSSSIKPIILLTLNKSRPHRPQHTLSWTARVSLISAV